MLLYMYWVINVGAWSRFELNFIFLFLMNMLNEAILHGHQKFESQLSSFKQNTELCYVNKDHAICFCLHLGCWIKKNIT